MVQYGPIVDTNVAPVSPATRGLRVSFLSIREVVRHVAPVSPATRGLRDYFYFLLYLEQEFEPHRCPRLLGD